MPRLLSEKLEALKENEQPKVKVITLELDENVVTALQRLKSTIGFPIESMIAQSLQPFIEIFLPIADLYEGGMLTPASLPDLMNALDSVILKTDIAKARLDKKVKRISKQKEINAEGNK